MSSASCAVSDHICALQSANFACKGLAAYKEPLELIKKRYGSCTVHLATDGSEIIAALTSAASPLSGYHVIFHEFNRNAHNPMPGSCEGFPTCQWIEYRGAQLVVDTSGMGLSLVADLELLRGGDVFIGQFNSEVARLAWRKMTARLGMLPPWFHYTEKESQLPWHPHHLRVRI